MIICTIFKLISIIILHTGNDTAQSLSFLNPAALSGRARLACSYRELGICFLAIKIKSNLEWRNGKAAAGG
jgi:hypothetical protein